ncbi:pimeloyl-ACP methyl ester esterase BioH [Conchiformibius steedae]|uniref:pimeloyl-ACP methyl ester esterase BioH n=1 Tax=Conchiformibius steedae TaxID=153493 RepID=UPI0026F0FD6E|nr:pimeloyl-ACP methyl ester esterase BioH [Conchiformibius steedae]
MTITPSLCLIHGWAANGRIFDELTRHLPDTWQHHAPHLAGHGGTAPMRPHFSVSAAADQIAATLDAPVHLFGWSLGGLVSLFLAAQHPHKVKSLTLCSTFARFDAAPDYPEGVQQSVLDKMLTLFQQDYPKHMKQFLQLQLLHTPEREQILANVLPDMLRHGTPQALDDALAAVRRADARAFLPRIRMPVLLLWGGRDNVTPPRMGDYLLRHLPDARLHTIARAAHAPFLSHSRESAQVWADFVQAVETCCP